MAAAWVQGPWHMGEACGDLVLPLQHWRLCISHSSHDHINGSAISLTLNRTWKNHREWQAPWHWPPSVSVVTRYLNNTPYTCRVLWCDGYSWWLSINLEVLGWVSVGAVWRYVLGQCTSLVCALSWPRSDGYLVGQWLLVCLNSFQCRGGGRDCMVTWGVELVYWNRQVP